MAERPYFLKGSEVEVGLPRPLPATGAAPAMLQCPPSCRGSTMDATDVPRPQGIGGPPWLLGPGWDPLPA